MKRATPLRMLCVVVALATSATACSGGKEKTADSASSGAGEASPTQDAGQSAVAGPEPELTFVTPGPSDSASASASASAGASASATPTAAVTPGRVFAFLKTVDVSGHKLTYDQAEFLTGAAAAKAQKDAKEEDPLDFYIRNVNPRLRTATIAPDVVVLGSIVLSNQVDPTPATLTQLAALVASQKPPATGFWLTINAKGQVKKIEEQYVP